jgi:indole-3-glycerol phosphate synthase
MPASVLEKIVSDKKRELENKKRSRSLPALKECIVQLKPLDFAAALRGDKIKLIAEVKKASPSQGVMVKDFDPLSLALSYERGGAAAISVLTEVAHFLGSPKHLEEIRGKVNVPLLRKDFIFDEYQVYESAALGADAILLIAAILSLKQLDRLLAIGHQLGLYCLLEVHDKNDMEKALKSGAEIIGINNRDLNTFKVDIETTRRLRPLVPGGKIVVSESGIGCREDVKKLKAWGVDAVLVGEALVTAPDIPAMIKELLHD